MPGWPACTILLPVVPGRVGAQGFRAGGAFRGAIRARRAPGARPASRLGGTPGSCPSKADSLLTELRRGVPGALQRLRAHVPRSAAATDAATAELRDARL